MNTQLEAVVSEKTHPIDAKIGNAAECEEALSDAIAQRAQEIYEREGRNPGDDFETWRLAENEVLRPLCCGVLDSKDEAVVSFYYSALGAKDIEEVDAVVEPHRLILVGKKHRDSESGKAENVYRVLPLKAEFDPSSVKLEQHGSFLDIELHKSRASAESAAVMKAA